MSGNGIELRTVAVVPCNGKIQGFPYKYTGSSHAQMRLTAADAESLVAYNGLMLAPRGWHCDLIGGSNGDTLTAYNLALLTHLFDASAYLH